jgi:hypothetical protein
MGRMFFAAIIIGGLVTSICFGYSGGSGTPEEPYQIANKEDLLTLAGTIADYNKCFILTADIDMEGEVFTTAIIASGDVFTGTFDGNSHKITHFTINGGSNDFLGLFGYINGLVKNLGLENCSVSGSRLVGGLVGQNECGSISNCYSIGAVTGRDYCGGLVGQSYGSISNCYSTGAVTGGYSSDCLGGLVGYSGGTISNCYSTGDVNGTYNVGGLVGQNEYDSISNCYSIGAVTGEYFCGGLVGQSYGSIINCYSTGTVSGSTKVGGLMGINAYSGSIGNCYSTGAVGGTSEVGGLVGDNDGTVLVSFWDIQTSGQSTSAGGTELNTTQMMQQASFTGWDFTNIWAICEGMNYPKLSWQIPPVGDFTCPDGVDFIDFAIFANAWLSDPMQVNWNSRCNIAESPDSIIDILDLAIFTQHWLEQD